MALTVDDVALHVTGKPPTADNRALMTDLLGWTTAMVDQYVGGSPIPDPVRRSAILRLAYFDHWTRTARRPGGPETLEPRFRRAQPLNPLRASGAMSLLSPWKRRTVAT